MTKFTPLFKVFQRPANAPNLDCHTDDNRTDYTLLRMMTSAQVVETSVNVTTNSPSQDYTHPDDHNLPTYDMTPAFKPFTVSHKSIALVRTERPKKPYPVQRHVPIVPLNNAFACE